MTAFQPHYCAFRTILGPWERTTHHDKVITDPLVVNLSERWTMAVENLPEAVCFLQKACVSNSFCGDYRVSTFFCRYDLVVKHSNGEFPHVEPVVLQSPSTDSPWPGLGTPCGGRHHAGKQLPRGPTCGGFHGPTTMEPREGWRYDNPGRYDGCLTQCFKHQNLGCLFMIVHS